MEYVIAGAGAAGITAAITVREIDREGKIMVISREKVPYSPVFLADYLEGEIGESNLYIRNPEFYRQMKIELVQAEMEDFDGSEVFLTDGREIEFDKFLIATGSKPLIPPISGVEKENVFTFQSLNDAKKVLAAAKKSKKAAVIGAGPIGLEVAYSLRALGLDVIVFELLDRILPGLVEAKISEIVEREFSRHGIEFKTGASVEEFVGNSKVEGVVAGETYPADLVILSTGVKPNIEAFAKRVEVNRGILVNKKMETSLENVYAAGDVAEAENAFGEVCVTPTWINAVTQGRVAGMNMAGRDARHEGSIRVNVVKKSSVPVISLGLAGESFEGIVYHRNGLYRKAFFDGEHLVGFQSAGSWSDVSLAGIFQFLIRKKIPVKNKENFVKRPLSFRNFWNPYFNK
ncbi:hypothetical protein DRP07_12070 [Archaeoglobales archaeon]|nr:MAG: hypothetical protein DRP07_12070 [Archaeoglobales archaeon]